MLPDFGGGIAEWERLNELLEGHEESRGDVMKWIFEYLKGYVYTRELAGEEVFQKNRDEGIDIIHRLLASSDEDNRETAILSLEGIYDKGEIRDADILELLRPLLNDPSIWLQLEVAEALKTISPNDVSAKLKQLETHESSHIVDRAKKLLEEMQSPRAPSALGTC
ncbi:HEAT repeat domain-containing protein [Chloroflexia bacterium SDU3-3]|nr:HEAT repeat domain-containing protein [Chloroflexia bacterium SDU3-3]